MAISDISNNNILIARQVVSAGDSKLNDGRTRSKTDYDEKQAEIEQREEKEFADADTGGFMTDAGNQVGGFSSGVSPVASRTSLTLPGPPPYEVTDDEVKATGTFVSSVEELEYDMGSATRDISSIVIHWSETFSNANLTGRQVKNLTGGSYHYIIKRDGSVERDKPINSAADHAKGHNKYSIAVCLVGGVSAATEDQGLAERVGAGSITRSQYNSLYQIMRVFYTQYPGGQALGHSEIDNDQDDPGFEVRDYAYNLFNKSSLFIDPSVEPEKSPDEVNASVDADGPNVNDKDTELLDQKF